MTHKDVKVLMLQLREDEAMRDHELKGVLRSGKLKPKQVYCLDGLSKILKPQLLEGRHLFYIGGSGDYSVFDDLPFKETLRSMLEECRDKDIPVIGSCWGAQFMAHVMGGSVITDKVNEEVGTYTVRLTKDGQSDPVLAEFPNSFKAQIGHHERVLSLPEGAVNLAYSDQCAIQAFTWPGSSLYAFQFHPELNKQELVERISHYRDSYAADPRIFDKIISTAEESPWTDFLVKRFIDKIVLPRYKSKALAKSL